MELPPLAVDAHLARAEPHECRDDAGRAVGPVVPVRVTSRTRAQSTCATIRHPPIFTSCTHALPSGATPVSRGLFSKELARLGKMEKSVNVIINNAQDISEEVGKGKKALGMLLRKAKEVLVSLAEQRDDFSSPERVYAPEVDVEAAEE